MASVFLPADIDFRSIKFFDVPHRDTDPDDSHGMYTFDAYYKHAPLYVQFPTCRVASVANGTVTLHLPRELVDTFVLPLEKHAITKVHKKCETWFRGKRFTLKKITEGLRSIATSATLELDAHDAAFYNQFKARISKSHVQPGQDITCLVRVSGLRFDRNVWNVVYALEQARVCLDKKLAQYSILDEITDSISDDGEYFQGSDEDDKPLEKK